MKEKPFSFLRYGDKCTSRQTPVSSRMLVHGPSLESCLLQGLFWGLCVG